jgi:hypothetical protein
MHISERRNFDISYVRSTKQWAGGVSTLWWRTINGHDYLFQLNTWGGSSKLVVDRYVNRGNTRERVHELELV